MAYLSSLAGPDLPSLDYMNDEEENYLSPRRPEPEPEPPPIFGKEIKKQPRTSAAYDALQEVNAERPERQKPGFWRSLAAIGVGLGAGYSNATGKFAQQDVGRAVDGVANGGYNRKMADWAQRQQDAQENLKAAGLADKNEDDYLSGPVNRDYLGAQTDNLRSVTNERNRAMNTPKTREIKHTENKLDGETNRWVTVTTFDDNSTVTTPLNVSGPTATPEIKHGGVHSDRDIVDGKGKVVRVITYKDGTKEEQPVDATEAVKPTTDPLARDRARIAAQEASQRRGLEHQDLRDDQKEVERLDADEQKLHRLRGALGRELRKKKGDFANDPATGKPLKDAAGRPVTIDRVRAQFEDQYDQATSDAQQLQESQKAIIRRRGGGAPPAHGAPTSSGGSSMREQLGFPPR